MTFAKNILSFISTLSFNNSLPEGIRIMNPFSDPEIIKLNTEFYTKYYSDNNKRIMLLGINPGRFGAGITGICFTDPIKLELECGIQNNLPMRPELSSTFMYQMINTFGTAQSFYEKFFLSAVSPLGFIKNSKNMNYYDTKELLECCYTFIVNSLKAQIQCGINTRVAFCIGKGKNLQFLEALNDAHNLFGKIIPLEHPRWIMQYHLKEKGNYITKYVDFLNAV